MISKDVGFPVLKNLDPAPAFRVLAKQPIPVQVEPIMVGPSTGPGLVILTVIRIRIDNS